MKCGLLHLHDLTGRARDRARVRRRSRRWALEGLEERPLLSGATIYTVNVATDNAADSGGSGSGTMGDLRYVINQANANPNAAGSLIEFAENVFSASTPQTITLAGELTLSETAGPEIIQSPSASIVTLSGAETVEVFSVDAGVTASLSGLTIANGWGGGNAFIPGGAGGINNAGNLTLTNCSVTHDAGTSLGGIINTGTLTILASTIANNFANAQGLPFESAFGGGIYNVGSLTIANSTITGNSAYNGGGIYNTRSLTITNSTITANVAEMGGGIHNNGGTLTITNSTVATNGSQGDGSGIDSAGVLTCVNCTIAYNTGVGGGLAVDSGTAILDNTIVALNTTLGLNQQGGSPLDIVGTISASSAFNLIGAGGAGGLKNRENGNHVGIADPLLGTLAGNGGPTQTIALLHDSPALGAGSVALAVDPLNNQRLATDQRGFARIVNNTVDIGAFESGASSTGATPPPTIVGEQVLRAGRGNHVGIAAIELFFDEPLNVSRARNATNYLLTQTLPKGGGTVTKPVKLQVKYQSGSETVRLNLTGKPAFADGGELVVIGSAPKGITNTSGGYLDGSGNGSPGSNAVFMVLPNGNGVNP